MSDGVELTAGHEAIRLVKKDRAKLKLTLGLYALSLKDREIGKLTRASYFFARHLDDLLDGEMDGIADPVGYAQSLSEQIKKDEFDDSMKISRLAKFAVPILESKAKPDDNPRQEFVDLIDTMVFDYDRRLDRRTLSSEELELYYSQILNPGIDLMLIGFESEVRTCDIPNYSRNLGRLYSVRDLEQDWSVGIINVPTETLWNANLSAEDSYQELTSNSVITAWAEDEVIDATRRMVRVQETIANIPEKLSVTVLNGLASSAIKACA